MFKEKISNYSKLNFFLVLKRNLQEKDNLMVIFSKKKLKKELYRICKKS